MNFNPHTHIAGKVYDLTQGNMNALIQELERLQGALCWQSAVTKALSECMGRIVPENKRLREALEECAKPPYKDSDLKSFISAINAIARAALEGK